MNLNLGDGDKGDGGQKNRMGEEMKVVKEKKLARTKVVQALRLVREVLADRITEKKTLNLDYLSENPSSLHSLVSCRKWHHLDFENLQF